MVLEDKSSCMMNGGPSDGKIKNPHKSKTEKPLVGIILRKKKIITKNYNKKKRKKYFICDSSAVEIHFGFYFHFQNSFHVRLSGFFFIFLRFPAAEESLEQCFSQASKPNSTENSTAKHNSFKKK